MDKVEGQVCPKVNSKDIETLKSISSELHEEQQPRPRSVNCIFGRAEDKVT